MVESVRRGRSLQRVADDFRVAKSTVEFWVKRAKGKRLDRTDWTDRSAGPQLPHNRVSPAIEQCVLQLRQELKESSPLGEYGADAIKDEMERLGCLHSVSRSTINRILERQGMFDGKRRQRRPPPPTGWYLPDVAQGLAELDQFDFVEDLCLEGGRFVHVFNGISLHGGLVMSCPESQMRAEKTVQNLIDHWQEFGLPDYAQFDNSTVFQGGHHPDTLGKVIRLCLSLEVTPVFAPPHETGFQASIESYNGRWQRGVWQRFHFENLQAVKQQSAKYVQAANEKNAMRREAAPTRGEFPKNWKLDYQKHPTGKVIFIRRASEKEQVEVLGHRWILSKAVAHRLVRAEVDLKKNKIDFYHLRRKEPETQRHLGTAEYHLQRKTFKE
jgi:transposase